MPREPGDPLYEYEQQLLKEEEQKKARQQQQRRLDPRNMSTVDQIRYKKAEAQFYAAMAAGDPTATEENKDNWIALRMQGQQL